MQQAQPVSASATGLGGPVPLRSTLPLSTSPSPEDSPNLNASRSQTGAAASANGPNQPNGTPNNAAGAAGAANAGAYNVFNMPPPPTDKAEHDQWRNALAVARQKRMQELAESFPDRTLFCLNKTNIFRKLCIALVEWKPYFEYIILATIVANCCTLAIFTPFPNGDSNTVNKVLEDIEYVFMVIFTIECVAKIVASGLWQTEQAYLKNLWNVLDFIIVVVGTMSTILQNVSTAILDVRALRAFRVLRPLRLVSNLPSLQVVLNSILMAMIPLLHIALLVLFVICIYAIIGLELFCGELRKGCFSREDGVLKMAEARPCANGTDGYPCAEGLVCLEERCSVLGNRNYNASITTYDGPNYGITNFDNFLLAMLTVFTCISMEGWTDMMNFYLDGGSGMASYIYFVSMIIIGSFFVMNLILGVLSGEFSKERGKAQRRGDFKKEQEAKRLQLILDEYNRWLDAGEEAAKAALEAEQPDLKIPAKAAKMMGAPIQESIFQRFKKHLNWEEIQKNAPAICRKLIKSNSFYWTVIVMVLLNTAVLTTEHYRQPQWLEHFQEVANVFFVFVFTFEMLLKMYALGSERYFVSLFNRFDFIVVLFSIAELSLTSTHVMYPVGVSVLRCARLLRVFKVTRYWDSLRKLVTSLVNSMKSIVSLLVLLFLFIVIFALLGMQLFGGKFNTLEDNTRPRSNFDSFAEAIITVFQILTGEDWNEVMWYGIRSYGGINSIGALMSIYFILLFICGNYILLNVFLAIAVDNLADKDDGDEAAEDEKRAEAAKAAAEEKQDKQNLEREQSGKAAQQEKRLRGPNEPDEDDENDGHAAEAADGDEYGRSDPKKHVDFARESADGGESGDEGNDDLEEIEDETDVEDVGDPSADSSSVPRRNAYLEKTNQIQPIPPFSSFFLFTPENKFRKFCHMTCNHSYFNNAVLACILISSAMLAAEDPVNANSERNLALNYFDYFFTGVFTIEILLKVISYGLVFHEGAYIRVPFNLLDVLVVTVAFISYFLQSDAISTVKILRVLRVLRPLRAINRAKGLKHVVQCMVVAVKSIGNIMLVTFLLEFMFAVIGVQLFKGSLYRCNDASKVSEEDCQGEFFTPTLEKRRWTNYILNFDDVSSAMLALFAVSTFEGWPGLLVMCMDSTLNDEGPTQGNRQWVAIYFVAYIIIIAFFMVNIFVGFVIVTFQSEGEREYKGCELDRNMRKCIEFSLKAKPIKRFIPRRRWQYKLWWFVSSRTFEYTTFVFIVMNTVVLGLKFYDAPESYENVLDGFNTFFTVVFTIEFLLKLLAFEFRNYFADPWSCFDFLIVVGSIVDIALTKSSGPNHFISLTFLRLFRVMRLIKLLSRGEGIRTLLWTFMKSFQALPYVALLILLLFFIYAVIGMQMFGKIYPWDDTSDETYDINRNNNFQNFFSSILLLFRCATGEAWQEVMMTCAKSTTNCINTNVMSNSSSSLAKFERSEESCGTPFAYAYFVSFYILCSFLIINLFVAVIMDNFDYLTRDWSILGPHHLDEFVRLWSEYDPEAKGRIKHLDVVTLLRKISPPLGFGKLCPHRLACKRLVSMNMPLNQDGTVTFNATLFAIVRTNLKIKTEGNLDQCNEELRAIIRKLWKRTPLTLLDQIIPPAGVDEVTVGKFYATFLIQDYFRRFKKKKETAEKVSKLGGQQHARNLTAGLRLVHDLGAEIRRAISGTLDDEMFNERIYEDQPIHRRNHALFGDGLSLKANDHANAKQTSSDPPTRNGMLNVGVSADRGPQPVLPNGAPLTKVTSSIAMRQNPERPKSAVYPSNVAPNGSPLHRGFGDHQMPHETAATWPSKIPEVPVISRPSRAKRIMLAPATFIRRLFSLRNPSPVNVQRRHYMSDSRQSTPTSSIASPARINNIQLQQTGDSGIPQYVLQNALTASGHPVQSLSLAIDPQHGSPLGRALIRRTHHNECDFVRDDTFEETYGMNGRIPITMNGGSDGEPKRFYTRLTPAQRAAKTASQTVSEVPTQPAELSAETSPVGSPTRADAVPVDSSTPQIVSNEQRKKLPILVNPIAAFTAGSDADLARMTGSQLSPVSLSSPTTPSPLDDGNVLKSAPAVPAPVMSTSRFDRRRLSATANLVEQVLHNAGIAGFIDVETVERELQEATNMTHEELEAAASHLLSSNNESRDSNPRNREQTYH